MKRSRRGMDWLVRRFPYFPVKWLQAWTSPFWTRPERPAYRPMSLRRNSGRWRLRARLWRGADWDHAELEDRVLLSVTAAYNNATISFTSNGSTGDSVYVETFNGAVQWSTDGTTYSSTFGTSTVDANGGAITIDASNLDGTLHVESITTYGGSLSVTAQAIEVDSNATVSTRILAQGVTNAVSGNSGGSSGNLSLTAPSIAVDSGAALLAQATGAYTAGSITLDASDTADFPNSVIAVTSTSTSITLASATVKGGAVTLDSNSDSSVDYTGSDQSFTTSYFGSLSLVGGYAKSTANSTITISGGSINAGTLTVTNNASTYASIEAITVYFAVAYGVSTPTATTTIDNGAVISTTGATSITSEADSNLYISAQQSLAGISNVNEKVNITLAIADMSATSSAEVEGGSTINSGGALTISSNIVKDHAVSASSAAYADGTLGTAVAVGIDNSTSTAAVDSSSVTADGAIAITSDISTTSDKVASSSTVGSTVANRVFSYVTNPALLSSLYSSLSNQPGAASGLKSTAEQKFGLSAAVTVAIVTDTSTARVGTDSTVHATAGDVSVTGTSNDSPRYSAISYLNSYQVGDQNVSSRKAGISGAVSVGILTNDAYAEVDQGATVQATGDALVQSDSETPLDIDYATWQGLKTITNKLNFNFGIQNGFFSTWAEALSSAIQKSYGASIDVYVANATSHAIVNQNATIIANGGLSVYAKDKNDSLNLAGSPWVTFNASSGNGVGAAIAANVYTNDVDAEVDSGAKVTAASMLVEANNDSGAITIGVQGGQASNFGFNGTGLGLAFDNTTIARVDANATISLGSGDVRIAKDNNDISGGTDYITSDVPQFDPTEEYTSDSNGNPVERVDSTNNTITLPYDDGLSTGDSVIYDDGGGTPIDGLTSGDTYYVVPLSANTIQLAATYADATAANPVVIPISLTGTTGVAHSFYPGFDSTASGVIGADAQTINLGFDHGLTTGQPVVYSDGGGNSFGGLTNGDTYYVIVTGSQSYKLATSQANAEADIPITFTSEAGGAGQSLMPTSFDSLAVANNLDVLNSNSSTFITSSDANYDYTNLNMLVVAQDNSDLYNGAGGVTYGHNQGVGISSIVDVVQRNTEAIIGDTTESLSPDGFAPGVGVSANSEINLGYNDGFTAGEPVVYTSGGDTPISGLDSGETYYVGPVSSQVVILGRSVLEAENSASTYFDPSTAVTGGTTNLINLGYVDGYQLGDAVTYNSNGGASIGGLVSGDTYYVIPVNSTTIALADTYADALNNNATFFTPDSQVSDNQIDVGSSSGFTTGEPVLYSSGGDTAVGGLTDGHTYYVIVTSSSTIALASSYGNAVKETAITLDPTGVSGQVHSLTPGIDQPSTAVDSTSNTIDFGYAHDFDTGDPVRYESPNGTPISGLTSGNLYYAIAVDGETLALADSASDAELGQTRQFLPSQLLSSNGNSIDDTIELDTDAGYATGDPVVYDAEGGSAIGGLVSGNTYYIINLTSSTALTNLDTKVQLASSYANAIAGIPITLDGSQATATYNSLTDEVVRIAINGNSAAEGQFFLTDNRLSLTPATSTGSNDFRLSLSPSTTSESTHGIGLAFNPATAVSGNEINLGYDDGCTTGQEVEYTAGGGRPIDGLNQGQIYYVVVVNATTIELAETYGEATASSPTVVTLDASTATGTDHAIAAIFRPTSMVDATDNEIAFSTPQTFNTGDKVVYETNGGTAISGLTNGQTYYVIAVDSEHVELASSEANALNNVPITLDPSVATGADQELTGAITGTGSVSTGGSLLVGANNTGEIISVSLAGSDMQGAGAEPGAAGSNASIDQGGISANYSGAGDLAVNVVLDTTVAEIRDATVTTTGVVEVTAYDDTAIYVGAGAVAIANSGGNSVGIAGSAVINVVENDVTAAINNAAVTASGNVTVSADNKVTLYAVALGGAGTSGRTSEVGSLALNDVVNNTTATIESKSKVTATSGNVAVNATANGETIAGAGVISAAYGFSSTDAHVAFGASIAINDIHDGVGTQAIVSDSDVTAGGDVDVEASNTNTLYSVAAGYAQASGQGVAFALAVSLSFSVNYVDTRTEASIERKKSIGISADNVNVTVTDDPSIDSLAGSLAITSVGLSGTTGVSIGAAIGIDKVDNTEVATLDDATVNASGHVDVTTTDTASIESLAAGGAGGNTFALGGSFTYNVTRQHLTASIADDSTVTATTGDIDVNATDTSTVKSLAVGAAYSSNASVGLSIAYDQVEDTVDATLSGSTVTASGGNIEVEATGNATISTISVGVGVSNKAGSAGSSGVAYITNDVEATIQGSTVDAWENLILVTNQTGTVDSYDGTLGLSTSSYYGNAGSVLVNDLGNTTKAYISGSTVHARGNNGATVPLTTWDSDSNASTYHFRGLAVVASDTESITVGSVVIGASSYEAIGINVTTSYVGDTTEAYIDDSNATSANDVWVKAYQSTTTADLLGAAAVSLQATGGGDAAAAVDNVQLTNTTEAYITDSNTVDSLGTVTAGGSVTVETVTFESLGDFVLGVGTNAKGAVLAGAAGRFDLDDTNEAYISVATVDANGSLTVAAFDTAILNSAIGGGDIGTYGASGSINLLSDSTNTSATILGAITNAKDTTEVEASHNVTNEGGAVNLAGGPGYEINGSVRYGDFQASTTAAIENSATQTALVNQDSAYDTSAQDVTVLAIDWFKAKDYVGAATGTANGGAGGAFDVLTVQNTLAAFIGSAAKVYAEGNVDVEAQSTRNVDSYAVGLGISGTAALEGSLSLVAIGTGQNASGVGQISPNSTSDSDSTMAAADSFEGLSTTDTAGLVESQLASESTPTVDSALSTTDVNVRDVAAYIGSNAQVTSGGSLTVSATETDDVTSVAGTLAIGGKGVGVGGAVAIDTIATSVQAFVDTGVVLSVGGALSITANANETDTLWAAAGSGALAFGLGVQYAEIDDTSSQSATLGNNVVVSQASSVNIDAAHTRSLSATAAGASAASVAIGVSVATTTAKGTVEAAIGSGATLGTGTSPIGSVTVSAEDTVEQLFAIAASIAAGVATGDGNQVTATDSPTVEAFTGSGTSIDSSGAVSIDAESVGQASAECVGVTLAAGATGGGTVGTATVSPDVSAALGASNTIDATSLSIVATQGIASGYDQLALAEGYGIAGAALIGVQGADMTAVSDASAIASLGNSSTVTATSVTVSSTTETSEKGDAFGGSGGIFAVGAVSSNANAATTTESWVGANTTITATNLSVTANGSDHFVTDAMTSEAAFIGSFGANGSTNYGADAQTSASNTTEAYIANATSTGGAIDVTNFTLDATHNSDFDGDADNESGGGLANLGGARLKIIENAATVQANVGNDASVNAQNINVTAANNATSGDTQVTSLTGSGVADISGAVADLQISQATSITVGQNASIAMTGSATNPGTWSMEAYNTANIQNSGEIDASSFGAGATLSAGIQFPTYNATITIGQGASLTSVGEINAAAWSQATANETANAIAGGVISNSDSDATAAANSTNTITVGSNATLNAQGNINLLAGINTSTVNLNNLNIEMNEFMLTATSGSYANSLGPNASVSGETQAVQDNEITVDKGALLTTIQSAYLWTNKGIVQLDTSLTKKTTYTSSTPGGTENDDPTDLVTINGTVDVGTENQANVTIDDQGNVTTTPGLNISVTRVDGSSDNVVAQTIDTRLANYETLAAEYLGTADEAEYQAQIQFWVDLINELGGIASYDSKTGVVTVAQDISLSFWDVSNIQVQSGDIYVAADALVGTNTGALSAPGDTQITINNYDTGSLDLGSLTIPDPAGGHLYFRSAQDSSANFSAISSTSAINGANDASESSLGANFGLSVASATDTPTISVTNHPQAGETTAANILLNGTVSNTSGTVTINAGSGSVLAVSTIDAGTLSISSQGDFVLDSNSTGGSSADFQNMGGDPSSLYGSLASANQNAKTEVSTTATPIDGTSSTIVAGNVYISAQYLNINGTIQSGVPEHLVTINPTYASGGTTYDLSTYINAYNSADTSSGGNRYTQIPAGFVSYTADSSQDITVYWDAEEQQLELATDLQVKGGYISLVGDILNTGGGNLKVMDGYGQIGITNNTTYGLTLGSSLDAGSGSEDADGIAGKIEIIDTAQTVTVDGKTQYLHTIYTETGSTITEVNNETVDANGNPSYVVSTTTNVSGSVDPSTAQLTYQPAAQTYTWDNAYAQANVDEYTLTVTNGPYTSNSNGSISPSIDIVDNANTVETILSSITSTTPISTGTYVTGGDPASGDVYKYTRNVYTSNDDGTLTIDNYYTTSWDFLKAKYVTNYDKTTFTLIENAGNTITNTNSVKADQPIGITFMGNSGSIDVTSEGSVTVSGDLAARGGTVSITSSQGGIYADGGAITGKTIDLTAADGIGSSSNPVDVENTDVTGAGVTATATTGDIDLTSSSSNLTLISVVATSGNVSISNTGGNILGTSGVSPQVSGESVTLSADGTIGASTTSPLIIQTGGTASECLTASAVGNIYIEQAQGSLAVNSITSTGGDVWLDVPGQVFNANAASDPYNASTEASLLTLWSNLALIGTAAEAREQAIIDSYIQNEDAEYLYYWTLRGLSAEYDTSGNVVGYTTNAYNPDYSFQYSATLQAYYLSEGISVSELDAMEQNVTDEYFALNAVFGVGGTYVTQNVTDGSFDPTTYNPNFTYRPTSAEEATLTQGIVWTENELLWGLPNAAVEQTTDTQTQTESPNISGHNVTIVAGLSVGQDSTSPEIIDVPNGDVADITNTDEKVALLSAEADDISFYEWTDTNHDGEIESNELTPWQDTDGTGVVEPNEFNVIELQIRHDVNIAATGTVNVSAGGDVLLGSNGSLSLGQVVAGTSTNPQEVRIKVADNITSSSSALSGANVQASTAVLEAADGFIGAATNPVTIDLTGALTARAAGDITIKDVTGTFNVGFIYSTGAVTLESTGTIADDNVVAGETVTNVEANDNIDLIANQVGTSSQPLIVDISGSGTVGGTVTGNIYLSAASDLPVNDLVSTDGNVSVTDDANVELGFLRALKGSIVIESFFGDVLDNNGSGLNLQAPKVTLSAPEGQVGSSSDFIDVVNTAATTSSAPLGTYVTPVPLPSGVFYEASEPSNAYGSQVVLADFNGDGNLDADVNGSILLGDGHGNFTNSGASINTTYVGDLEDDGDLDAVVLVNSDSLQIRINQGGSHLGTEGTFVTGQTISIPSINGEPVFVNSTAVALGDFNGDGYEDIAVGSFNDDGVFVFYNNGDGEFSTYKFFSTGNIQPWSLQAADLNGDGMPDLLIGSTNHTYGVLLNDGSGNMTRGSQTISPSGSPNSVTIGDLRGNGSNDLFFATNSGNQIWLNNGGGQFTNTGQSLGTGNTQQIVLGDFRGLGVLDAFFVNNNAPSTVWFNNGSGYFTNSGQSLAASGNMTALGGASGDLNGDGVPDVFVSQALGNDIVWLNQTPPFISHGQAFSVYEHNPAGTVIGAVAAGDQDATDPLTYAITGGNTAGFFAINATTGVLSLASNTGFDYATLEADGANPFTLDIQVTDRTSQTATEPITISVDHFTQPPWVVASQSFSIDDNAIAGTGLGTVQVSDPEFAHGDTIASYAIVGGSGDSLFNIDPTTGALTYNGSTPLDADDTSSYSLTLLIQVADVIGLTNNTQNSSSLITIDVNYINRPPAVSDAAITHNQTMPVGTLVGQVDATDPQNSTLTYALDPQFGSGLLTIDSSTGQLYSATNELLSGTFQEHVIVTDALGLQSSAYINFTVLPYDSPLTFSNATASVVEFGSTNQLVTALAASDADTANGDTITYSLQYANAIDTNDNTTNAASLFTLNSATGQLYVNASSIDATQVSEFQVGVEAKDFTGKTATATVNITVEFAATPPTLSGGTFSLYENPVNGAVVGSVTGYEQDPGDTLTYSLVNPGGPYAINPTTGQITVTDGSALNYADDPQYDSDTFSVKVTDLNGNSATANVTVNLIPFTNAPSVSGQFYSTVPEESPVGTVLYLPNAPAQYDPDVNLGDRLTFALYSTTDPGAFAVDPTTGNVTIANNSTFNYNTANFNVTNVTSSGPAPEVGTLVESVTNTDGKVAYIPISVFVTEIYKVPTITSGQSFNLLETAAKGTEVGQIVGYYNYGDTWTILSGDPNGALSIDGEGNLTVAKGGTFNTLTQSTYTLLVQVQTSMGDTAEQTVTVNLQYVAQPDLAISETASRTGYVKLGDTVTYTIIASNPGNVAATGATVTDYFNGLLDPVLTSVETTGGATSALTPGALVLPMDDTVNLPVGATITYTVQGTVSLNAQYPVAADGMLRSAAVINSALADINSANNSAAADLLIELTGTAGSGTFVNSGQNVSTGGGGDEVVLGDLNGEGYLDAVVAAGSGVSIWINNGHGDFSLGQLIPVGAQSVALGDLNNDGSLDLFIGTTHGAQVWLNNGNGTFTNTGQDLVYNRSDTQPVYDFANVALADLTGNGNLDAIAANPDGDNVNVWINNGQGYFTNELEVDTGIGSQGSVALGDLNNDGLPDLVEGSAYNTNSLYVALNGGSSLFSTQPTVVAAAQAITGVDLADFNGSGSLDALATEDGTDQIFLNNGAGTLTAGQALGTDDTTAAAIGDLTGNGSMDILSLNTGGNSEVWLNNGTGNFTPLAFTDPNTYTGVALGDLDGNGTLDAFVVGPNGNAVYFNHTAPVVTGPSGVNVTENTSASIKDLSLSDADSANGSIRISFSSANGSFSIDNQTGSSVTISGTQDQLNTLLPTLIFTPNANFHGSTSIVITSNDGVVSQTLTIPVTVAFANIPPTLKVPTAIATQEGTPVTFNSGLNVYDPDSPSLTVQFSTADGTLTLGGQTGQSLTVSGSQAELNAWLSTMVFTPANLFYGNAAITASVSDEQNTVTHTIDVTVNQVYAPPQLNTPASIQTDQNITFLPGGFSVADVENHALTLTLTTSGGTFTLGSATGATVQATGVPAVLNTQLQNLVYAPGTFVGSGQVQVSLTDGQTTESATVPLSVIQTVIAPATVSVNPLVTSLPENSDVRQPIAIATLSVNSDSSDTITLQLSGPNANLFELVGNALELQPNVVLDFATQPVLNVFVTAVDPSAVGTPVPSLITVNLIQEPKFDSTLALGVSDPAPVSGESLTLTATLTPPNGSIFTPTGCVEFLDGSNILATVPLGANLQATLPIVLPVGSHSLTVEYLGNVRFNTSTSSVLNLPVAQAQTTTVLSAAEPSAHVGQAVDLTATVSVNAPGNGTLTGTVTFYDNGAPIGTQPLVGNTDIATLSTDSLGNGVHQITAVYNGDANDLASPTSNAVQQTITRNATTTALAVSPTSAVYGQSVRLCATVTGAGTPTGTVTFWMGQTVLAVVPLGANGTAAYATTPFQLPVGTQDPLYASYAMNETYFGSVSSLSLFTVSADPTTTSILGSSANPSVYGQAVTFTAHVSSTAPGCGVPTGSVVFRDGATVLGSAPVNENGVASFTTAPLQLPGGAGQSITATYVTDGHYAGSASPALLQTVNKGGTTMTVSAAPMSPTYEQRVTLSAAVVTNVAGVIKLTGTVAFYDGATLLGTGTLAAGVASFTTAPGQLAGGSHTITAQYEGDANLNGSVSAPLTELVNKLATTTTLSGVGISDYGSTPTFTADVASTGGGSPTGTVTFFDGVTPIGTTTLSSGVATLNHFATPLTVGNHAITARYNGDSNFTASTSLTQTETVEPNGGLTLKLSTTAGAGGAETVTVTLQSLSGTPTGTVTLYDGNTLLGTVPLTSDTARLTTTALGGGSQLITVRYNGDPNHPATTLSAYVDVVINAPSKSTTS